MSHCFEIRFTKLLQGLVPMAVLAGVLGVPAMTASLSTEEPRPAPGPKAEDAKEQGSSSEVFGLTKVWTFHLLISAENWKTIQPARGPGGPGGPGRGGPPGGPGGFGFPGGPGGFGPPPGGPGGFGFPGGPGGFGPPPGGPGEFMPPGGPGEFGRAGGSRGVAQGRRAKTAEQPAETSGDAHRGGGFGVEFPWVHAEFTAEGKTYKDVGLRFKGNAGYMATAGGLKRPFKIDFNRYVAGQQFHGLKMVSLNAGAMDPTQLRESLSYAVFREAGVPAPRTALVRLYVTIPGTYQKEFAGLYTLVENVDKTFLKDRFQSAKGLLLKPERVRALDYLGENWISYADRYQPKTDGNAREKRRLIEFAKLVNNADEEQFRKEIGSYLDVDEFLRFLAANTLLANLDSFLGMGHNYFLYLHPKTLKFAFIPWDLDLSFAAFGMRGPGGQLVDLSITHPHTGQNNLIERLLAMPEHNEAYRQHLKRIIAQYFNPERLGKDAGTCEALIKDIVAEEAKAVANRKESRGFGPGRGPGPMSGPGISLAAFVAQRVESVNAQLAGKSKGFSSADMPFGPGGGRGKGFGPGPQTRSAAPGKKSEAKQ